MVTRIKTIEFGTTTNNVTLGTSVPKYLSGSTFIYIPETGGTFAFISVLLQIEVTGDNTATGGISAPILGIKLGNVALSTAAGITPVPNSGEQEEWTITRDVTSYFTTNWVGTSMVWYALYQGSGISTSNHSSKIIITYQYDDTAATNRQIKTIRIPIESTRSLLTTSYQTIGGATAIPAITNFSSPYLSETGITVRQVFLELYGNSGIASTGAFTVTVRVNGSTTYALSRAQPALNSAPWYRMIVDITSVDLSAARSLECSVSIPTYNRMCTFGGMIVVTYEFDANTSTRIYNSLMLGAVDTSGWIGGTTTADQGVWERNIYIEEPGTITMKESGLSLYQNDSGGYTFNVAVSGSTTGQTYQSYVNTAGTLQCGCYSMVHRIDDAGQRGQAGMILTRGKNLYRVSFYSGTAQAGWNLSGFLMLNYISDKHTDGVGTHAHSVYQHVTDSITASGSRVNTSNTITPKIPESNYYLIGYLFWLNYSTIGNGTTGSLGANFNIAAEVSSGETNLQGGEGWISLYDGQTREDGENMNGYIYAAARNNFKRWNGDPDTDRMDIKLGRRYILSTGPLWTGSMGIWYTYNSITYPISGTCSGYSGDGSGIPIEFYRITDTQTEHILDTITSANGIFSTTWIDDTDYIYASARQDDFRIGRSANGLA